MRNINAFPRRSETQGPVREPRTQAGPGDRPRFPRSGAGERENDRVSERRGGACYPLQLHQSRADRLGKALEARRVHGKAWRKASGQIAIGLFALVLAGCSSHKPAQSRVPVPPPPPVGSAEPSIPSLPPAGRNPSAEPALPVEPAPHRTEIDIPSDAPVLYTETGLASWYGPHYNKRRSSNGEVYDMDGLTAAHRTLPLNSIARVTNVKTGESILLRITDRGPFVGDRVIDLSKASAKRVGVYSRGGALVKIDV